MMFLWIVFVDVEHWEICERCEWLNIVLMLVEYILNFSFCVTIPVMAK